MMLLKLNNDWTLIVGFKLYVIQAFVFFQERKMRLYFQEKKGNVNFIDVVFYLVLLFKR